MGSSESFGTDGLRPVETLLESLEASGGYAILAGATLVGVFWLLKLIIAAIIQSFQAHEADMLRRFDEQMERERMNQSAIQSITDRVIVALEGNTRVISTVVETTRAINARLETIDRHLERWSNRHEQ